MDWVPNGSLQVERLEIAIANLPPGLAGTILVQLSDFHYENGQLSEKLLRKAIAATNQADPHLILLTGDYVTKHSASIHHLIPHLKNLKSRLGIYAILGNHDIYTRKFKTVITRALTSIGIQVLCNEIVYPLGSGLAFVGLNDFWSNEFHPDPVFAQLDPTVPRIVLSHQPDTAQHLQQWRIDLQLSGHTHGGQVVLPGIGPLPAYLAKLQQITPRRLRRWLPYMQENCHHVVKHWEWSQGLHHLGSNRLYVNRGLGSYRPGRLFCPPEVTVIKLVG